MKLPRDRVPVSIRAAQSLQSGPGQEGTVFCNACGQRVSEDSAFCSRCGKPLSKDHGAITTRSAAAQQTPAGQVGFVAGEATRQFLRAGTKVWLPLAVLLLLFVGVISFNTSTQQQPFWPLVRNALQEERKTGQLKWCQSRGSRLGYGRSRAYGPKPLLPARRATCAA